jgi:glutathione S-transferase
MTQPDKQLISLPGSPWSERASFAIYVAGLSEEVKIVPYVDFVDELYLRYISGRWNFSQNVTVPVLRLADGSTINDSLDIAKWAAMKSNGKLKIPDNDRLQHVVRVTESILSASRFRGFNRVRESGVFDAQDLPSPLRLLPDSFNRSIVRLLFGSLLRKHSDPTWTMESALAQMRSGLKELESILKESGGEYFEKDEFSLADVIASSAMGFVAPLPNGHSRTGPNFGKCWVEPEVAEEFKDLVAWRDALYVARRGPLTLP